MLSRRFEQVAVGERRGLTRTCRSVPPLRESLVTAVKASGLAKIASSVKRLDIDTRRAFSQLTLHKTEPGIKIWVSNEKETLQWMDLSHEICIAFPFRNIEDGSYV